jgi:hypothetical protein
MQNPAVFSALSGVAIRSCGSIGELLSNGVISASFYDE